LVYYWVVGRRRSEMSVNVVPKRALVVVAALLAAVSLAAGCGGVRASWVPDGGTLTSTEVDELAKTADLSQVSSIDVADAPEARTDVLVWLRTKGADGARAASLLTKGFPDRTAAVPVLVEVALVDGVRSLIVVEAAQGIETAQGVAGALTAKRLWLFEFESGSLIRSATFQ